MEMIDQLHTPVASSPGKITGTHWTGGWVGPTENEKRRTETAEMHFLMSAAGVNNTHNIKN
jgi:hypothetical protein